ncbi:MAG: hypothetical protein WA913_06095 [Pricia sp.]
MSAKQISKFNGLHRRGAKSSDIDGSAYGKLNGKAGALQKDTSLKKEEASIELSYT